MKKVFFSISAIALLLTVFAPTVSMGQGFNQGKVIRTRQAYAEGFGFNLSQPTLGWGLSVVSGWNHVEVSTVYRGYQHNGTPPVHSFAVGVGGLLSGKYAYGAFGIEAGLNGVTRSWSAENRVFGFDQESFMFKPSFGFYLRGGLTFGGVLLNAKVGYAWTFGMDGTPSIEGMDLIGQTWTAPALTAGIGLGFGSRRISRFDGDHRLQVWGGYSFGLGESSSAYTVGMDWFRRLDPKWIGFLGIEANQTSDSLGLRSAYFCGKIQRIFFDTVHEGSWLNIDAGLKLGVSENYAIYEVHAISVTANGDTNRFDGGFGKITQAPSFGGFFGVNIAPLELLNVEWHYGHIELGVKLDYSYTIPRGISLETDNVEATQQLISQGRASQTRLSVVLRWTL